MGLQLTEKPSGSLLPFFLSVLLLIALLSLAILTGRLPESSGEVDLLFPVTSESLDALHFERGTFEDVYTDTLVFKLASTERLILDTIEEELLEFSGVTDVILPRSNQEPDPFGLISKDDQYIRIILKIDASLGEARKRDLNEAIRLLLQRYSEFSPLRAGSFVTTQEVSKIVADEASRVTPLIIGTLFLVLLILSRSLQLSLLLLGSTLMALATSVLLYSLCGYSLGPISQLAPPFLLAVGTSFHLHFASRFLSEDVERLPVLRELRLSIGLAAATTFISLATLSFLDVTDVTRFAMLAGCGTILMAFYACVLQRPLLLRLPAGSPGRAAGAAKLLYSLINRTTIVGVLCLTIFFGFGISRLEVHTDPLSFLPEKDKTLQQIKAVNHIFPGNHYISIILTARSSNSINEDLRFLVDVTTALNALPDVERVISVRDFETLFTKKAAADFVSDFSVTGTPIPLSFLTTDRSAIRLLLETQVEGKELISLADSAEQVLSTIESAVDYTVVATSFELIMAEQSALIVQGLIESLAFTLSIVFLLLLFIFGEARIALMGLIPNVLPLVSVFGVLGLLQGDLDFGSCLVAAAALGIAVDNTFHFLLCWKAERGKHGDLKAVTKATLDRIYFPFFITTIVLVAGFSVMGFARSLPVMHFGVLLSVTLIIGLCADLVVLPYFLAGGMLKRE